MTELENRNLGEKIALTIMYDGSKFHGWQVQNNARSVQSALQDGLENILSTFKELKRERLICLFGCGGDRDKTKRPIMGGIASKLSDFVIVTSDNPRSEEPKTIINEIVEGMKDYKTPYVVIENRADAIKYAVQNAREGDLIVLAGKGHETYQILADGKIHFDEREVVAEALA